jgi:hypothetical protein
MHQLPFSFSATPLCAACVDTIGGACSGPDGPWRLAAPGEPCGAHECVARTQRGLALVFTPSAGDLSDQLEAQGYVHGVRCSCCDHETYVGHLDWTALVCTSCKAEIVKHVPELPAPEPEPRPVTREAIWAWINSPDTPKDATIGDGCDYFGVTPSAFISIRDGKGGH